MKAICFGSLNIDYTYKVDHFVKAGETLSSESLEVFSGGKGLNQSVALAKAGVDVWHAGAVGKDGTFLLEQMEQAGVNTECVKILEQIRTGNAIIQNDKNGDNCILLYGGANQAITRAQVDAVMENCQSGDFLILQNEINEVAYIIEKGHEKGLKIVLNPSPMDEKIKALSIEYVDYLMLNEIEAGQILSKDNYDVFDKKETIEALMKHFPNAAVILTLGKEGAVYADKKEMFVQASYRVDAVDTTAAGDTFTGYFIGGIMKDLSAGQAMNMAAKASAIAVTRSGASPSIPVWTEVDNYKF